METHRAWCCRNAVTWDSHGSVPQTLLKTTRKTEGILKMPHLPICGVIVGVLRNSQRKNGPKTEANFDAICELGWRGLGVCGACAGGGAGPGWAAGWW